jgi:hypothetical protein
VFPFRRPTDDATKKQTVDRREVDGNDESLDALLDLFGRQAVRRKPTRGKPPGNTGQPGGTEAKAPPDADPTAEPEQTADK